MKTIVSTILVTCLLTGCLQTKQDTNSNQQKIEKPIVVLNFDEQKPQTVNIDLVNASSVYNKNSGELDILFHSKQHDSTSITFTSENGWDWSNFNNFNLAFDIANHGEHSTQIYLDITDDNGDTYTRSVNIPVNTANTYYAKMAGHDLGTPEGDENVELNFKSGLRSNPETWQSDEVQFISLWGKKNLNLKSIKKIAFSVQTAMHDKTISIGKIRLRENQTYDENYLTHIVDKYGQGAKTEFAIKIHNDKELFTARDEELKSLKNGYDEDTRSIYGGWKNGPRQKSTGYFYAAKINDKWSLVDPLGYPYFATGLDIIRLSNSTTMTGFDFDQSLIQPRAKDDFTPEDSQSLNRVPEKAIGSRFTASQTRQQMFEWLPDYNEPLGKHYGYRRSAHSGPLKHGETYSFYAANLERKYAPLDEDYIQVWRDVTLKRMQTWGFTSLGNWTDKSFYSNQKVPFFANGWIIGDFKTVSSGNDFWAPLPDVFDPKFEERAMATLKQVGEEVQNTPWCVGVFVDNEKSFGRPDSLDSHYGIVLNTLPRNGKDVPTKAAFTRVMKDKYKTIGALNKSWGTTIKGWQEFDAGVSATTDNVNQLTDLSLLLTTYAEKYFAIVSKAKDKYLPNHLYMGARFPDWGMPKEVVDASAKHADVISFNSYKEGLPKSKWAFLQELDKPAIIGEWHIGARDAGLYHPGLIHASDQQDRGKMYKDYMKSVIDNPNFVGAHWFQYMDSPITGRAYDGENYNVGFVNVTDTPYKPLVNAATEINMDMYERRYK